MRAAVSLITLCISVPAILAGCQSSTPRQYEQVSKAWESGPGPQGPAGRPAKQSARWPAPDSAVAVVNDRVITWGELHDLLMSSRALSALQQLILLTLAEDLAQAEKVTVSEREVEAEYERALGEIYAGQQAETGRLERMARQALLAQLLEQRGLSQEEFRLTMRVNALLREIAAGHVQVRESDVEAEYQLRYGERVEVRHIQMATLQEINEVSRRLDEGEDFAAVARACSQNLLTASQGGLLPAFAYLDPTVPDALREAAFSLQPGQVSMPIRVQGEYHVLKLERRLGPEAVPLDQVRAQLEAQVTDRLVREKMRQLRDAMIRRCQIRILDAELRQAYNQRRSQLQGPLPPPARP